MTFDEFAAGLMAGDFSRLEPQFATGPNGEPSAVVRWFESGQFGTRPKVLAEAFTCACFNGCMTVVEYFLNKRIDPGGGDNTGLNAIHWASNRGQLKTVELLLKHHAPLERLNSYGGTALGGAVWSAVHEPKPDHPAVIEALLKAGAQLSAAEYPSGDERINHLLERYGARK